MNIEDLAKRDLFNYDQFDVPTVYDPYRHSNILKDSNRQIQTRCKNSLNTFYQQNKKPFLKQTKRFQCDTRHSLKRLLQRLQSLPSPNRNQRKTLHQKFKTSSIISSTEPLKIKKKSSFIKICHDDKNCQNQRQKMVQVYSKPMTAYTQKSINSNKQQQQNRIQKLIKKKLAQKNKLQQKNKTEKLINFLRENSRAQTATNKKREKSSKIISRKLINYLC